MAVVPPFRLREEGREKYSEHGFALRIPIINMLILYLQHPPKPQRPCPSAAVCRQRGRKWLAGKRRLSLERGRPGPAVPVTAGPWGLLSGARA